MEQARTDQYTQRGEATLLLAIFAFEEALFAVDALRVQEIIRKGAITPVHHAPAHVLGIINLRGRIVTVLDPASRMGLAAQARTPASRILILDWQDEQVGLLVSRIHDMVDVARDRLAQPPSNLRNDLGAFLAGVVQVHDHMVSVLELGPVLAVEDGA